MAHLHTARSQYNWGLFINDDIACGCVRKFLSKSNLIVSMLTIIEFNT